MACRYPKTGADPETYIKVKGKWVYLYRAIDKEGNSVDFYLSSRRNAKTAKHFLGKALRGFKDWQKPSTIDTDKAPSYGVVIEKLKNEGKCPKDLEHRQVKYLNNRIEADHGRLKRLIIPDRGFKSMKTAYTQSEGQALPQSKVLK